MAITKMVDFPERELVKGNDAPQTMVNNDPNKTHVNTPTIKDVKEICKKAVDNKSTCPCRAKVDPNDDDVIIYNDGFQVDNNGDATVGRDLYVEDEVIIDNLQKIVDTDGDAIIPDPSGHAGHVLYHTSTGYGWKKVTEGVAEIRILTEEQWAEEVTRTGVLYFVYKSDHTCTTYYYAS